MQEVSLFVDDALEFDKAVAASLPAVGDIEIISKTNATKSGGSAVMVILELALPDGTTQKIRAYTKPCVIRNALSAIISAHSGEI